MCCGYVMCCAHTNNDIINVYYDHHEHWIISYCGISFENYI